MTLNDSYSILINNTLVRVLRYFALEIPKIMIGRGYEIILPYITDRRKISGALVRDNNIINIEEYKMVEKIKGILKPGDILITEPSCYSKLNITDWVAKVSRIIQRTRWGHTSLYDGCGRIIEVKVDVLVGRGKKFDGVTTRLFSDYIREQNFIIVRPIVKDETRHVAVDKMRELLDVDNLRYDKFRFLEGGLDLLGFRTMKARNPGEVGRIICSEAIAKAYWGQLKFMDGRHYSQILPTHILNSPSVSHIAVVDRDILGKLRLSME